MLDTVLDRTVVPGYSKIGYRIRSRGFADLPRMDGKVVLITGATSGLGLAAAEGFARLGASVWLAARNRERGEDARRRIVEATGRDDVHVTLCDLSDLGSVRGCAEGYARDPGRLDVLVNNAGVLTQEREVSVDGIELTLATNVVGPFLLTNLLLGTVAPFRIVNVSSGGMYTQGIDLDDLQSERGSFHGPTVYARTKRAEVILTELWAERGAVAHAMHPGWVDTPGVQTSLPRFSRVMGPLLRTADEGADTIVWLGAATEPGESSGGFWHDRRRRPTHIRPGTRESAADRRRLWDECVRLSDADAQRR